MTDQAKAEQIVDSYLCCLSEGDLEGVVALYADDATVEDPVGSEPITGRAAIAEFYRGALAMGIKLRRSGAVRLAAGEIVFPFVCASEAMGAPMEIEIIDHFVLNAEGKVQSMRAFWSEANIRPMAAEA
ncbi:nuclear transport factor 2 family protein [Microbulbifer taiwanensis]|uniref:Nuclear transport factor 2 family protein n=1 Tax=Microbulbifer taiwanensis TaxID=986746 RepID=A0ABW1YQK4_9GAMM|nr:nuclear transport factor 2 family protein [Microbulbifer taiwanensis]